MLIYVVVAVVVVGGGYWVVTHQGSGAGAPTDGAPATQAPTGSAVSSFADIIKVGADVQCDVSVAQQGGTVHGTVYVSGKGANVRGDFSMTMQGREMHSSMIKTGGYVYVWSDMMPQGFKAVATESDDPIAAMNSGTVPAGTNYDCHPWVADMSKFVVPANITFAAMPGR